MALALHSQVPRGIPSPLETKALRLLIRQKLIAGRLPQSGIPRIWGHAGDGEQCKACDEIVTSAEFVMEGIVLVGDRRTVHFHVLCFNMWDDERTALGGRTDGHAR